MGHDVRNWRRPGGPSARKSCKEESEEGLGQRHCSDSAVAVSARNVTVFHSRRRPIRFATRLQRLRNRYEDSKRGRQKAKQHERFTPRARRNRKACARRIGGSWRSIAVGNVVRATGRRNYATIDRCVSVEHNGPTPGHVHGKLKGFSGTETGRRREKLGRRCWLAVGSAAAQGRKLTNWSKAKAGGQRESKGLRAP